MEKLWLLEKVDDILYDALSILLLSSICIDEDFEHSVVDKSECCNNPCMLGKNISYIH